MSCSEPDNSGLAFVSGIWDGLTWEKKSLLTDLFPAHFRPTAHPACADNTCYTR